MIFIAVVSAKEGNVEKRGVASGAYGAPVAVAAAPVVGTYKIFGILSLGS